MESLDCNSLLFQVDKMAGIHTIETGTEDWRFLVVPEDKPFTVLYMVLKVAMSLIYIT